MNIAIEYMLRDQRVKNLLRFPCSLFLENSEKKKVIVALSEGYGRDWVIVRRYNPLKAKRGDMLPPCKELAIKSSEVFEHTDVVLPGYSMLEFKEEPYETPEKHHSDMPHAAIQERDYRESLELFFNPKAVRRAREDWLWECFESTYVPPDIKIRYGIVIPAMQREYVSHYCKSTWKIWEYWKKHLLDFVGPASELIFAKSYKSQFLKVKVEKEPAKFQREPIFYGGGDEPPFEYVLPSRKKSRRSRMIEEEYDF